MKEMRQRGLYHGMDGLTTDATILQVVIIMWTLQFVSVDGLCSLALRSWGFDDSSGWIGYAQVNGWTVVDYTRSPNGWQGKEDVRGFNTILLQPEGCISYDTRRFDTYASTAASDAMANYINGLPGGTVIYGVTCDSAAGALTTAARNALASIGVGVSTLEDRGKLVFVAVVGKTLTSYRIAPRYGNNLLMSATVSACVNGPCLNGATCADSGTGYVCNCRPGFFGNLCQDYNYCAFPPCENSGTCVGRTDGYDCLCHLGFSGKNCEIEPAANDPCSLVELSDCGGTFTSPNYPEYYYGDNLCQWLIQSASAEPNGAVALYLADLQTIVNQDTLTIYDGDDNTSSPVIARLSGNLTSQPNSFVSTQRYMFVEFIVSSGLSERGFNASYRARSYGGACSPTSSPVNLTDDTGTITSPNFPDAYSSLVNCSWRITASSGSHGVVKLVITDFSTADAGDTVSIYDGDTTGSRLIGSLMGRLNTPLLVQSTQSAMLVVFSTNAVAVERGFSASYTSAVSGGECSPLFRPRAMPNDDGTITSPNFPDFYYNYANCEWLLTAAVEPFGRNVVTLDFDSFDTELGADVVYLYDGVDADARRIAILSGTFQQPPKGFSSTGEHMFVRFVSSNATTLQGFTATYRTTTTKGACSSVIGPARFTEQRGQFTSPNYPFNYYDDAECRWLITADGTYKVVTVYFDYFDTQPDVDVLSIYDGRETDAPLIANLSGSNVDFLRPYMSTLPDIFLRFKSDLTINSIGFSAEYTTTTTVGACSERYRPRIQGGNFSTFSSPNYPGNYVANADCRWQIIAIQPNGFVTIQFDFFETYNVSDVVYIHDGPDIGSPLMASFNGSYSTPPGPLTTTGRQMTIRFVSDALNNARGFSAMVRSLATDDGNPCSPTFRPRRTDDSYGSFSSPRYPFNYTHNSDCQWLIESPAADSFVILNFDFFETELHTDFVYVYDGRTTADPLLARIHGSNCIPLGGVTSSQPFLLVRFTSDATLARRGFSANFKTVYFGDSCSAVFRPRALSSAFGTFTSPSYPAPYYNNADCEWLITSDRGLFGVVTLDFTFFDTQTDADFVYVYDGGNSSDPLIVRLHGSYQTLPRGITTVQSMMLVRFTSDGAVTGSGFSANYKSTTSGGACSRTSQPLRLYYGGIFAAPNYAVNYYENANCSWLIESSDSREGIVRLTFDYFNTQLDVDVLRVYDGIDDSAPEIGRLSGSYCTHPTGFTTTQPYMFVRFVSDAKISYRGFKARFSSIAYGGACSPQTGPRLLAGSGGTLSSPNYPCNYFDNANCHWLLQTSNRPCEILEITFQYFYTEFVVDSLSLYDGPTVNATLIAGLSGTYDQPPSAFYSTGQFMLVEFITDSSTNYGGFKATYRSILGYPDDYPKTTSEPTTTTTTPEPVPDPCSPFTRPFELTDSNGTLTSANYPDNYDNNSDCQWRITSPNVNGNVTIEFDDFNTDQCCDIVYVYDGDSDKAPLIGTAVDNVAETRTTSQRYMYVKFVTDEAITKSGWSAKYTTT